VLCSQPVAQSSQTTTAAGTETSDKRASQFASVSIPRSTPPFVRNRVGALSGGNAEEKNEYSLERLKREVVRTMYMNTDPTIRIAAKPILFEQRDCIYRTIAREIRKDTDFFRALTMKDFLALPSPVALRLHVLTLGDA
jgi:hypothetical protein